MRPWVFYCHTKVNFVTDKRVAAKKVYGAWQTYIEGRREEERKIKTANTYLERTTLM